MATFEIFDSGKEYKIEAGSPEEAAEMHGKGIGAFSVNLVREMPNGVRYYTASVPKDKRYDTRSFRLAASSA